MEAAYVSLLLVFMVNLTVTLDGYSCGRCDLRGLEVAGGAY